MHLGLIFYMAPTGSGLDPLRYDGLIEICPQSGVGLPQVFSGVLQAFQ